MCGSFPQARDPVREKAMRNAIALPIVSVVLIASLVAGCGGDDSGGSTDAGTSTTSAANGNASVCATYALVQSAGKAVEQLDPSKASADQVKRAVSDLSKSVQALSSAASEAAGQAASEIKPAVSRFESQLDSAAGQPASQQLSTLGTALGELESSLKKTISGLDC
jgi:hypothetical protein